MSQRPSAVKASALIGSVCPWKTATLFPVATSHSLTVPSLPPEASSLPSTTFANKLQKAG